MQNSPGMLSDYKAWVQLQILSAYNKFLKSNECKVKFIEEGGM
jgi:hypothetical protein